ncbi:MAG: polymer-forming cytoskeletal protein [Bacteroidales bacterium]|nr:polymer-forming cytoskeletal protein [Bacteroidales bacterium]MDD2570450.1 polymer-forming cytoskeletal protein [Bacteroidales bacterium]MDD2813211.1 polymer-forming cytoskeletal protein [Bacteroidales bacterium]MDD3384226.1 polymer-forming cytoskeletal protein [Bacteroidales bacterium]MDD3811016.1 polymer-forming cytoskeletal protein [Bacteroidales bacterium]
MSKEVESTNAINLISTGTIVKGDVESNSGIRLDGQLEGNLSAKGKVVIGNAGELTGNIMAVNVEISGVINGNVKAAQICLKASAKITGDIITQRLSIEPGAFFFGTCRMEGTPDGKTKEATATKRS